MSDSLIWLHEDALRATHPVFAAAGHETPAVHVWDDQYLQQAGYSLKRLVFLYETLCELPVKIIRGDTLEILQTSDAAHIFVPSSDNPWVQAIIDQLGAYKQTTVIDEDPFVTINKPYRFTRFHRYWKMAEKMAFALNGDLDA